MAKELLSVEIYKTKDFNKFKKDIEKIKTEVINIDDLTENYTVIIRYSDKKIAGEILEPDAVNPMDAYELNETISEKLKELGFEAQVQLSEKQLNQEINQEAINMFKKIAKRIIQQKNSKNEDNDG